MAIQTSAQLVHWNYFLTLEDDLLVLSRFVDFSGNAKTFSLEIARLLMAASAECDVVLKQVCRKWEPQTDVCNLTQYFPVMSRNYPTFKAWKVTIPRFGLTLNPWVSWTAGQAPLWWTAHNQVKHQRHTHFREATLKHCLNAVAGLYVAVLHLYPVEAQTGTLAPPPRLFDVAPEHSNGQFMGRAIVPMYFVPAPP